MNKEELFEHIKKNYGTEDLDDHIIHLKAEEAAAINNAGPDEQLEYLYEKGGQAWMEEVFLNEDHTGPHPNEG